jgi:hypothetical protein
MRILLLAIIPLFLAACSKEITLKEQDYEKKLVINGLLFPDSLITVRIGLTYSILSGERPVVTNATVKLFTNGRFTELLQHHSNGIYHSTGIYPVADSAYTVQAELEGFPTATATDTVPQKTYIIFGSHASGITYDEYGDPHQDYEIIIDDKPGRNYYELFFVAQQYFFYHTPNPYYYLHFQTDPAIADPVLRADSELDYYVYSYIFRDNLFDGQQYRMINKFNPVGATGTSQQAVVPTSDERYAMLRTTSQAYFNYRKYWIRHSNNQQIGNQIEEPLFMSLVGDPVTMYTNVEGGYGIFAAYNPTYFKLEEL